MEDKRNPLGLTKFIVGQRLRDSRYKMVEPPINSKGKQYKSEQWNLGLRFIFDNLDDCIVQNWYGCSHCQQLWNRILSSGSSDMLNHVRKCGIPIKFQLTVDEMYDLMTKISKISNKVGEIPRNAFERYAPKPENQWY